MDKLGLYLTEKNLTNAQSLINDLLRFGRHEEIGNISGLRYFLLGDQEIYILKELLKTKKIYEIEKLDISQNFEYIGENEARLKLLDDFDSPLNRQYKIAKEQLIKKFNKKMEDVIFNYLKERSEEIEDTLHVDGFYEEDDDIVKDIISVFRTCRTDFCKKVINEFNIPYEDLEFFEEYSFRHAIAGEEDELIITNYDESFGIYGNLHELFIFAGNSSYYTPSLEDYAWSVVHNEDFIFLGASNGLYRLEHLQGQEAIDQRNYLLQLEQEYNESLAEEDEYMY